MSIEDNIQAAAAEGSRPIIYNKYAVIKYNDTDPKTGKPYHARAGVVTPEILEQERSQLCGVFDTFIEACAVLNNLQLATGEIAEVRSSNATGRCTNSVFETRWGI